MQKTKISHWLIPPNYAANTAIQQNQVPFALYARLSVAALVSTSPSKAISDILLKSIEQSDSHYDLTFAYVICHTFSKESIVLRFLDSGDYFIYMFAKFSTQSLLDFFWWLKSYYSDEEVLEIIYPKLVRQTYSKKEKKDIQDLGFEFIGYVPPFFEHLNNLKCIIRFYLNHSHKPFIRSIPDTKAFYRAIQNMEPTAYLPPYKQSLRKKNEQSCFEIDKNYFQYEGTSGDLTFVLAKDSRTLLQWDRKCQLDAYFYRDWIEEGAKILYGVFDTSQNLKCLVVLDTCYPDKIDIEEPLGCYLKEANKLLINDWFKEVTIY